MTKHRIIALSYAKQALQVGSREYARMKQYSEELEAFHVIVYTKKDEGLPDQVEDKNLFVYGTNTRTKLGSVLRAYYIGKRIIAEAPDQRWTVSCQDPFETSLAGVLLSRLQNTIFHVQVHGDNFGNPYWKKSRRLNWLRLWFGAYVLKKAVGIRAVSKRIKMALVEKGVVADKISVLPIQPSLAPFLQTGASRNVSSIDSCTFLFVGRFEAEKNLPMLIRAFADVRQQHVSTRLRLVGDGSQKETILSLIEKYKLNDAVEVAPWTALIAEEMQHADVFVLPSDHEGYALVLLEAMAAGLPIVTTDVGCVGEVVIPEVHALVSSPRDTEAFTSSLTTMADMKPVDRHRMGQHNHKAAQEVTVSEESYTERWVNSHNL